MLQSANGKIVRSSCTLHHSPPPTDGKTFPMENSTHRNEGNTAEKVCCVQTHREKANVHCCQEHKFLSMFLTSTEVMSNCPVNHRPMDDLNVLCSTTYTTKFNSNKCEVL